jgi:hypothetical protein
MGEASIVVGSVQVSAPSRGRMGEDGHAKGRTRWVERWTDTYQGRCAWTNGDPDDGGGGDSCGTSDVLY